MMSMILHFPMLVAIAMYHKFHHQDVRQRAEKDHRRQE